MGRHKESFALFRAHAWRWDGLPEPPPEWELGGGPLFRCFERGLISRLGLEAGATCRFTPLWRLFAAEPVTELVFDVGEVWPNSAAAFRKLPPFPWPVRVAVTRNRGPRGAQDAFISALLSAPVMASVTELELSGLRQTALVEWLAKAPFLGAVRSLDLAQNGFGCATVCDLVWNPSLVGVSRLSLARNRISNAGALALARSPHLCNVEKIDLRGNSFGNDARDALVERFGESLIVQG